MSLLHKITHAVRHEARKVAATGATAAKSANSAASGGLSYAKKGISAAYSAVTYEIEHFGRDAGWALKSYSTLGAYEGELVVAGGGVAKRQLYNHNSKTTFSASGVYLEGGVGAELFKVPKESHAKGSKSAKIIDKLHGSPEQFAASLFNQACFNKANLSYGGGLHDFLYGGRAAHGGLTLHNVQHATWIYVYLDATILPVNASLGILFMMPPTDNETIAGLLAATVEGGPVSALLTLALESWAWCPYGQATGGIGVEVGALCRMFHKMNIGPLGAIV